ncbi:MAG: outer membrane protein assembly factor BamB [Gammaproteobacteria bacterium]|jgi:outer membrane protein assembly factor BamB
MRISTGTTTGLPIGLSIGIVRLALSALLLSVGLSAQQGSSANWPQFRGPSATGVSLGAATPVTFGGEDNENVLWRTPVPGLSHSSPVVWGERVFISTAVQIGSRAELASLFGSAGYGAGDSVTGDLPHLYQLWCLEKSSGVVLWTRTAHRGVPQVMRHPKSSHANPTPACDAERVVVSFGSEGLFAFDHDGNQLWKRELGYLDSAAPDYGQEGYQWGFASSPVLGPEHVFVQCDHEGDSYVAAFKLSDGSEVWRTAREESSTWSTPTVVLEDTPQLVLNGYRHIGGYSLDTGESLWRLVGGGDVPVPTPVAYEGLVFLTSAHGPDSPLRAVQLGAEGEVLRDGTDDDLLWENKRRGVYMQTPLVHDGLVWACSDAGILACYDFISGEAYFRERLGDGSYGFSGSPVFADGKLYLSGEGGIVTVVNASKSFEVLAQNDLGETLMATPAISDGILIFRGRDSVIAVRK